MITPRSFIPATVLVLAAVAQPASATQVAALRAPHLQAKPAQPVQLQASLGSHILAVIRHILAGDDTIHRG